MKDAKTTTYHRWDLSGYTPKLQISSMKKEGGKTNELLMMTFAHRSTCFLLYGGGERREWEVGTGLQGCMIKNSPENR
jgi:hypothetical protein